MLYVYRYLGLENVHIHMHAHVFQINDLMQCHFLDVF